MTAKISKPNPYFKIKFEADTSKGVKSIIKDELNTIIKETFSFIITDRNKDKLVIEFKNENDNKLLAKLIIPLLLLYALLMEGSDSKLIIISAI